MFGEISPKLRWSGKFPGITGLGTITNGAWNATPVTGQFGGTGQSSYTIGDILYASGSTALSKLAGVATGNVLISGGVGTAPSWGKVGLTTHVSGILAGTNGGTGVDNGTKTITLGGNLTTSGAFNTTFTVTGTTAVTLPTTGTLVAAGSSPSFTGLTIGTLSGVLKASSGVVSGSATTTDLTEGTNLYYTDARARAALSTGNGISYNSTTGVVSANIITSNLKFTSSAIDTIQPIATTDSPTFDSLTLTSGPLKVGVASTTLGLHVKGNVGGAVAAVDTTSATGDCWNYYQQNGTLRSAIGYKNANAGLTFFSGGADRMIVKDTGEVTMPTQSAFLAYKNATSSNVTGDGTLYSYICNTEVFDQNADYDNATGVFTAPVTGRYCLSIGVICTGGTTLSDVSSVVIITSNRRYIAYIPTVYTTYYAGYLTVLADMDAGDTANPAVLIVDSGGKIADVFGDTNVNTFFSGYLAC